jgi:O-antigen/teichoic acid export membrane protein
MSDKGTQDTLSTGEIKTRSLSGARWLLITRSASIPAALATTVLLARTGKEVLGAYALAEIFVGVIATFVVFGGSVVMTNFMPKVSKPVLRGKLLFAYLLIVAGLMAAILSLFRIFPGWLEYLLRRPFDTRLYLLFIGFAVVEVTAEILAGVVAGLMHIKTSAVANLVARYTLLPVVAVFFFVRPDVLRQYPLEIILGTFFIGRILSIGMCVRRMVTDPRFEMAAGWHLPSGFMAFCWTTHLATLFSFVYLHCDRLIILHVGALAGLGMYQAVIKVQSIIELVPRMLSSAFVPMLSSLIASGNKESAKRAYMFIQSNGTIIITVVALPTIAFSREILSVFGPDYVSYFYLLSMFSLVNVIAAPYLGNTPLLISLEKNRVRLTASTAQIGVQLAGMLAFAKPFGVLGIAGSRMFGRVVSHAITIPYVIRRLKMGLRLPRSYKAGVAVAAAVTALRIWVLPEGLLFSLLLTAGALVAFVLAAGIRWSDVKTVVHLLTSRRRRENEVPKDNAGGDADNSTTEDGTGESESEAHEN